MTPPNSKPPGATVGGPDDQPPDPLDARAHDPALPLHRADIRQRRVSFAPLLVAASDLPADFFLHPVQIAVCPSVQICFRNQSHRFLLFVSQAPAWSLSCSTDGIGTDR